MQAITDPRPLLSLYVRRKLVLGSIPNSAQFFWMMVIIIVIYLTKRRIAWESWFLYSSHLKENPSDLRNLPGVFNTSGYWVAHSITMIFEERWTNWNFWGHEKIRAENYNFESLAKALENILDKEGLKGVIKILNPRNKSHLDLDPSSPLDINHRFQQASDFISVLVSFNNQLIYCDLLDKDDNLFNGEPSIVLVFTPEENLRRQ